MTDTQPIMTDDDLPPYARAALDFFKDRCRTAWLAGDPFIAPVTSADLVAAIDPRHEVFKATRWAGLRQRVLEPLAEADRAQGRPHMAALVRQPRKWEPTDGFWTNSKGEMPHVPEGRRTSYWEGQITAVVQLWGSQVPAGPTPAHGNRTGKIDILIDAPGGDTCEAVVYLWTDSIHPDYETTKAVIPGHTLGFGTVWVPPRDGKPEAEKHWYDLDGLLAALEAALADSGRRAEVRSGLIRVRPNASHGTGAALVAFTRPESFPLLAEGAVIDAGWTIRDVPARRAA
jgi:hypothetical protein